MNPTKPEILDLPTCPGWWWSRASRTPNRKPGKWILVPVSIINGVPCFELRHPDDEPVKISAEYCDWVGPILPPEGV